MSEQTPTSRKTRQAATETGALPMNGLTLLGTFLRGGNGDTALLRHGSGRIEKVAVGDRIGWRRVVAIEQGMIVLARNGEAMRLRMPGQ